MSDPFSITAGAVGIATAFNACIECFNYIQLGRHFGRDFQTCTLLLACAKIRLARWGDAVDINRDPMLKRPGASSEETQMAKKALLQILVLFANTEKISKKHKLRAKDRANLPELTAKELDPNITALNNIMKQISIKSWAIYQRVELQELVIGITSLIENLEKLFPGPKSQLQTAQEQIVQNPIRLSLESSDNISYNAGYTNQADAVILPGHYYTNLAVDGRAQIGDAFSDNWEGTRGVSHRYNGVQVCKNGKALIGNEFGGTSIWEI